MALSAQAGLNSQNGPSVHSSFVQNGPSVYSSCVQNGPSVYSNCVQRWPLGASSFSLRQLQLRGHFGSGQYRIVRRYVIEFASSIRFILVLTTYISRRIFIIGTLSLDHKMICIDANNFCLQKFRNVLMSLCKDIYMCY